MVEQLGLATMPLGMCRRASALTSGTTSGTSGSMRQALELSMTMAPACAAIGADSRLTDAGVLDRTMSTPGERLGADRLDGVRFALERDRFARAALGGEEFDGAEGERMLVQHLPHDFADRTGRADYRNAWQHRNCPFDYQMGGVNSLPLRMETERPFGKGGEDETLVLCGFGVTYLRLRRSGRGPSGPHRVHDGRQVQ